MNLLITPNVIINCLLLYEQEHQTLAYDDFLNRIIDIAKNNDYSIFMTEIDLKLVNYYHYYFKELLARLIGSKSTSYNRGEAYAITDKIAKLLKMLISVEDYIDIAQAYPMDESILNLATYFSINNPSDAIRFATAIAGEKLNKATVIDAIITWEPSHFCQDPDSYFAIRNRGYGVVTANLSNRNDNNSEPGIRKNIYTPSHFIYSRYVSFNPLLENPLFRLIGVEIKSATTAKFERYESTNIVKVTIEYNRISHVFEQSLSKGVISALLLAIHVCVKRKCLAKDTNKRKLINKNLLKKMIFSVSPVKGDNEKIHADIVISDQDIQVTKKGSDLLYSTGEAYIKILNHVINRSMMTL